jgi:hypothetical protein
LIRSVDLIVSAREARTGDYLITGTERHLVVSSRTTRDGTTTITHPAGSSTIAADATVKVRRRSRVVDHDATAVVHSVG